METVPDGDRDHPPSYRVPSLLFIGKRHLSQINAKTAASCCGSGFFLLLSTSAPIFDWTLLLAFVAILFCVAASALISGSEIAFFSFTPQQLEELKGQENKTNKIISKLLKKPDYLLATILIANNLFNIALILVSNFAMSKLINFGNYPSWVEFVINTILIASILVLFGEVLPKIYATRFNVKFAQLMAFPISIMRRLFKPMSAILISSTKLIENRTKKETSEEDIKELGEAIDLIVNEETPEDQANILKGLAKFSNISASQIQQPRVNVVAIDVTADFEEVLQIIMESNYSRLPVYKGDLDEIVGLLFAKDLLEHNHKGKTFKWQKKIRDRILFIPESKKLDDLLKEFKQNRIHMAVVVDEYGGTEGIVTLEDVVERVVGDINNDTNDQNIEPKKIDEFTHIFEADTLLIDFCRFYKIDYNSFENHQGESESLGGLLLELAQGFPELDDGFRCNQFMFTAIDRERHRITEVKVTQLEEDAPAGENDGAVPRAS